MEQACGQGVEDVPLEQDLQSPVGEEAATSGFDLGDGKDSWDVDTEKIGGRLHRFFRIRQT